METFPLFLSSSCSSSLLQQQVSSASCRCPLDSAVHADGCCSGDCSSSSPVDSSSGAGSSSGSSRITVTIDSGADMSSMDESVESLSSNVRGVRHGTSGRCWLSPGGVSVPPAPPSSPESLLVLAPHMKSVPSALALDSAAAAAAALAGGSSSSLAALTPDTMASASSSISTCSSHNRRPSSNMLSPTEVASDVSSPFASLSPACLVSSAATSCIEREPLAAPPPDCLSDNCVTSNVFASSHPGSICPDAAAASAAAAGAKATSTLPAVFAHAASTQLPGDHFEWRGGNSSSKAAEALPTSTAALDSVYVCLSTPAVPFLTTAGVGSSADAAVRPFHGKGAGTAAATVSSAAAIDGDLASAGAGHPAEQRGTAGPRAVTTASECAASTAALQVEEKPAIVVLDTGALLRLQQLAGSDALLRAEQQLLSRRRQPLHSTTSKRPRRIQFVAPASVLREIRDARSRAHALQQQQWAAAAADTDLPLVMTATEVDKRWARSFAAKTGDLRALSSTDLDVIALTYMLQRQTGQVQHLRDRPVESVCVQRRRCSGSSSTAAAENEGAPRTQQHTAAARSGGEDAAAGRSVLAGETAATAREFPAAEAAAEEATLAEETKAGEETAAIEAATAVKEGTAAGRTDSGEERGIEAAEGQDDVTGKRREEKRFLGEGTEVAEAEVDAAADTKSDVESEATAAYEGSGRAHKEAAASGLGGVKETRNLVKFNSDNDDDGEGEWISLDNVEQLKRNAAACMFEEAGFPSALPRHDAACAEDFNESEEDTVSIGEQVEGEERPLVAHGSRIAGASISKTEQRKGQEDEEMDFRVACKTTDYSVQNVLLHMGLNVLAVDGYAVRSLKTWALLCRACQYVTRDTSHLFCPKCGQHAVDRVPVSFDGKEYALFDNRKKKCTRGLIHSLPKPKGGRHENQLILAEDQLMMGGRDRLLRHQQRMWESENAEHNFFGSHSAVDPASWYARTRTRTGHPATGVQAPHVVVGLGPGNPNSNRWMKKRGAARPGKTK